MKYLQLIALFTACSPLAYADLSSNSEPAGICSVVYTNLDGSIRRHSPLLTREECLEVAIDESKMERQTFRMAVLDFFVQNRKVLAGKILLRPKKDNLNACTLTHTFLSGQQANGVNQATSLMACIKSGLAAFDRQSTLLDSLKISFGERGGTVRVILFPRNLKPAELNNFSDN